MSSALPAGVPLADLYAHPVSAALLNEALALLDALWQDVPKSAVFPESPQTEEQRRTVRRFAGNGDGKP